MPTLKEIRQQYPMYSDMPDADFAKAFHEKFYNDLPFADFSKKIGYMKGANPSEYDSTSPEYQARYGATNGMSGGGRYLAGIGKGLMDMVRGVGQLSPGADTMNAMAGNFSAIRGDNKPLVSYQDVADARSRDANLMGTSGGKWGGVTGTAAAAIPTAFIPGANTYAGSALIGAGLGALQPSTSLKETATNTALGGILSPAALLGGRAVVAGAKVGKAAFVDPFTKKGQERIAANTLQAMAGGKDKAIEAAANIRGGMNDLLPGIQPTTAEVARNEGLSQLERTLKNNAEFTTAFGSRAANNRNAIVDALDNIAGDPARRTAAEAARDAATSPLYKQATNAAYAVDKDLADLLNRPAVQQAMKRAEILAANEGRPFQFVANPPDVFSGMRTTNQASRQVTGQGLQDLKMAMDEMLSDPASGFTGKSGDVVKNLRGKLLDWMEKANPDFKQARTLSRDMAKPVNQMDIGQALRDKLLPAMTDYGAQTPIRGSAFAQAMRNGDATAAQAMGRPYGAMSEIMSPDQMKTLAQIGQQLGRRSNADNLGRAVGSNTGQNFAGQNAVRQLLGPFGVPQNWVERSAGNTLFQGVLGIPGKIAGGLSEPNILKKLVELGLSPEEAAKLLEMQAKSGPGILGYGGALAPLVNSARQGILNSSARE
jgi:hypothetical protein